MLDQLAERVLTLSPEDNQPSTPLPGVTCYYSTTGVLRYPTVYQPSICLIAQGRKEVYLGDRRYSYDSNHYLLNSLTLPIEISIPDASNDHPYLGIGLDIDRHILGQMILDMREAPNMPAQMPHEALLSCHLPDRLSNAVLRLLSLANDAQAHSALAQGIWREIYFEVLRGPMGYLLHNCIESDAQANRMAPVIHYIDTHYKQKVTIQQITDVANMSASALHERFKQVTTLSPMQYLKNLRLHRAHTLILSGETVNQACYAVGYQSASQFSREFKRFFGFAPSSASPARYTPETTA